ncbi:hypothetical protein [Rhodococcus sp. 06-418-5]|uniref:hypothetical protein n=1 Tax=Rhodococcus sp. 06-418-5 TaxID=2022507 RepID=UPI00117BB955|nr:hypothetical protein [Rhodococcus sp. 06-418-5]
MSEALLIAARNVWPMKSDPIEIGIENGIPWAIAQNGNPYMPALCGYAQIPAEGHPLSTVDHFRTIDDAVRTPGGITWGPITPFELAGKMLPGRTLAEIGGWVGFDTGHSWDYWDDLELARVGLTRVPFPGGYVPESLPNAKYWTVDAIRDAAKTLASQIGYMRTPSQAVI